MNAEVKPGVHTFATQRHQKRGAQHRRTQLVCHNFSLEDLLVDFGQLWGVACGFTGVGCIETLLLKWHVQKVSLDHCAQVLQPCLLIVVLGPLDLQYNLHFANQSQRPQSDTEICTTEAFASEDI